MKHNVMFRKALLAAAVLCLAGVAPQFARSATACCDCPIPSVGIFDFVQNISPPGVQNPGNRSSTDYRSWNDARTGFLRGYQSEVQNDPVCSLHFTSVTLGAQYKQAVGNGDDPGSGAFRGDFDYLLRGVVDGDEARGYFLKVKLSDGTTNESIWEVNTSFMTTAEAEAAGRRAAAQMMPLMDKICDFWRRKREENTENAVNPTITIKPQSEKMNVGDTVTVEFTAIDCDRLPLKNRKIKLSLPEAADGEITPAVVTTDANGKATAQFKAKRAGFAVIHAELDYTSIVKHKPKVAERWKGIYVGDPPSGVWQVSVDITEEHRLEVDLATAGDEWKGKKNRLKVIRRSANLVFMVKGAYDPGLKKYHGDQILDVGGGGQFSEVDRTTESDENPRGSKWLMDVSEGGGTLDRSTQPTISFEASPETASIGVGVSFTGKLDEFRYIIESGAVPCCTTHNDTIDESDGIGIEDVEIKVTPQDSKNGVYTFNLEKTETETNAETGMTETHRRTGTITLVQLRRSQTPANYKP